MKTLRLVLLITAAIVLLAGCSYKGPKTNPGPTTTLIDTYWKLVAIDGNEVTTPQDAKEAHLILRPDYRVTGFGSCNAFSGTWQIIDEQLEFGPLAATKMACDRLDLEYAFMAALDGLVITEIEGGMLVITGREGAELTFKAMYFQ